MIETSRTSKCDSVLSLYRGEDDLGRKIVLLSAGSERSNIPIHSNNTQTPKVDKPRWSCPCPLLNPSVFSYKNKPFLLPFKSAFAVYFHLNKNAGRGKHRGISFRSNILGF